MAPTDTSRNLLSLPTELLDKIFLDAVKVRTCWRAVRLRLVNRTFDRYTTEAILRAEVLHHVISPRRLITPSTEARNGENIGLLGRPAWLPLVARYRARQILKGRRSAPLTSSGKKAQWRDTHLLRLAERLCELRPGVVFDDGAQPPGGHGQVEVQVQEQVQVQGEDLLQHHLETVASLDLFRGEWCKRRHLLDQLDDWAWDKDDVAGDLVNLAVWSNDADLIRQLLHEEQEETKKKNEKDSELFGEDQVTRWANAVRERKLSRRIVMAAEKSNLETIPLLLYLNARFNHGAGDENRDTDARDSGTIKLSTNIAESILVRAYKCKNPALFHFALDAHDESEPWNLTELCFTAMHCPSAEAYRRITAILVGNNGADMPLPRERLFEFIDRNGMERLASAASSGYLDLVQCFLDPVAGPKLIPEFAKAGRQGITPAALWAPGEGQYIDLMEPPEVRKEVRKVGREKMMRVALWAAVDGGCKDVVEFLLGMGADPTPHLTLAIRKGHRGVARQLIDAGADVQVGETPPLAQAVVREDTELLRCLVDRGALSGERGWHGGARAMSLARVFGLESMVDELLSLGVEYAMLHWVDTSAGQYDDPVQARDYDPWFKSFDPLYHFADPADVYSYLRFDQAHALPVGDVVGRKPAGRG